VVTPNGDHVAFVSLEWRLTWNKPDETHDHTQTTYYVWSRGSGQIREVPVPQPETQQSFPILGGRAWPPAISEDGKRVAFGYEAGALPSSVLGVFYHSDGDERPTLIKGTDEPPGAAAFGLSFDGDKVILALVENGTPRLVEANAAGSWSNVSVPATFEGLFAGRVSADRKWLVAVDLDADATPRLGAPQSDVVVFAR
jgi:hypothetical protein